ncbi:MAG: DUF2207 domain-containing protein [Fimbriimonas sp.]
MKLVALSGLLALAALAPAAKFTTQRFDVDIAIERDGTMTVREQIAVTFTEPQRGLIRKLPSVTRGRGDLVRRTQYELIGVNAKTTAGNNPATAVPETVGGDWQIRIGRRDVFLTGPVTYMIAYRVRGALTPFSGGELGKRTEFHWNVLPTNWATDIGNAKVKVTFPTPKPGAFRARVNFGPLRSRAALELQPGKASGDLPGVEAKLTREAFTGQILRPFHPGETMTVVIALPGDTVVAPKPEIARRTSPSAGTGGAVDDRMDYAFERPSEPPASVESQALGAALPFVVLIPLLLWRRKYRFREGPLVVQFDPPEGIGPSECGLIMDRSVDPRDIVAGILSLAQKGAAKVRPHAADPTTFTLSLKDLKGAQGLTEFEKKLYAVLKPYGPNIDAMALRGRFGSDYRILSAALQDSIHKRGLTLKPGLAGCGCAFAFFTVLFTFFLSGAVAIFLNSVWPVLGGVVVAICTLIAIGTMGNLNQEGTRIRTHVRGLREFIRRADQDELRHMSRTMPAQALYERLLPFAVAFGFIEQWAKAFEGMELSTPEWFDSPYGGDPWTLHQMNQLLIHDYMWQQSVTPPPPEPSTSSSWSSGSTSSYDSGSSFSSGDSGFSSSSDSGSSGSDSGSGGGGGGGDSW